MSKSLTQKLLEKLSCVVPRFEDYDFSARESIGYGNIEKINDLAEVKVCQNG